MTFGSIRSEVARVVDNGIPANDPRVAQRVNQAQRRLHAIQPWLGALAKYKVDVASGIFILPSALEAIHRVHRYEGSVTASGDYLLCDNAYAFVLDDGDLLPLSFYPLGSTTNEIKFQIDASVSPIPTKIVVTGKKKCVDVFNDADILTVQDLEAIKLMVMAIFREENNQLEMAAALELKAVQHLTSKTESAVEIARRISYQTKLSTQAYGSMGFTRAKLALDLELGVKMDEARLFDAINKAQDLLVSKKRLLLSSVRYGVKDGLSLPVYAYITSDSAQLPIPDYQTVKLAVQSILAGSVMAPGGTPNLEVSAKYEELASKQLEDDLKIEQEAKRHGTYNTALATSSPNTFGYTKARLALELPNGLTLSAPELARLTNRAEENLMVRGKWAGTVEELTIQIPEDGLFYLPVYVDSILSATMNDVPVPVYDQSYDYSINGPGYQTATEHQGYPALIARGERIVANQRLRVYFARNNFETDSCVRLLIKRKPVEHLLDTDPMVIRNYTAIHQMALSLMLQASNPEQSKFHEEQALLILRNELEQHQGGHRFSIQIQSPAFGAGEIGAMV